jgi:hypothetical protein
MRFLFGFPYLLAAAFFPAHAGAWLPEQASGKIILSHIEQSQRAENVIHFQHGEIYQSLLAEYGLSKNFAVMAKYGQHRRAQPNGAVVSNDHRIGLMLNTPILASGLLPPYVYRLAKAALPVKNMRREKRASLTLGWQDETALFTASMALADKISFKRFHISQEVELDQMRGQGKLTRNWLYRFSLGYGGFDIGSEAGNFVDYINPFASLIHSSYAQWSPHGRNWQMRVKNGTSRAPLGARDVQKNDYWAFELQYNF